MKRLVIVLLLLTPWAMRSMEPEEVELKQETIAQDRPSLVRLIEEVLPGDIPHSSSTKISQVIAQKMLRKKPHIRQFILSQVSLPFTDCFSDDAAQIIKFNSTGDKIVTAPIGGTAILWNSKEGKSIYGESFKEIKFNPAGDKIIMFNSKCNDARIWDSKTDEFIDLEGHTDGIWSPVFNPAGDRVVTCSNDGTAKIWDAEMGVLLHTFKHDIGTLVVFNTAGDQVATGSRDGTAMIWDTAKGILLQTLKGQSTIPLDVVGFNTADDKVVTTTELGDTKVWDIKRGKVLYTLGVPGDTYTTVYLSSGGKVVIGTMAMEGGPVNIWDLETGKLLHTLPGKVNSSEFSQAGDKVVTYTQNAAMIWQVETGKLLHCFKTHEKIRFGRLNAAGDKLVTIHQGGLHIHQWWPNHSVRIWDIKTGELLYHLETHEDYIWLVEFNPAGDKVAVGLSKKARIWDLEPLFKIQEFLTENTTHRQVAILNDIFDVKREQNFVKALKKKAFEKAPLLSPEAITFDFNKYPHLWDEYNAMPEVIRRIFDPYVTKLSSSTEEQAQS